MNDSLPSETIKLRELSPKLTLSHVITGDMHTAQRRQCIGLYLCSAVLRLAVDILQINVQTCVVRVWLTVPSACVDDTGNGGDR